MFNILTYFVVLSISLCSVNAQVVTTVIDDWGQAAEPLILLLEVNTPPSEFVESSILSDFVLGEERDILLIADEGDAGTVAAIAVSDSEFNFAAPAEMSGRVKIQYDGHDGSSTLQRNGLQNVDLTVKGGDGFRVKIECDIGATIFIHVYSPVGDVSSTSFTVGHLVGLQDIYIPFSQFNSVNFENVGAIEIEIPFEEKLDLVLKDFDVVTTSPSRTPVLEFVRPVEGEYIDFTSRCVKKIRSSSARSFTEDFDLFTSSSSSAISLIPKISIVLLCFSILFI